MKKEGGRNRRRMKTVLQELSWMPKVAKGSRKVGTMTTKMWI